MLTNLHRFALEFFATDGRVLTLRTIVPDWEPALEWAQFAAWRRGGATDLAASNDAHIDPIADRARGLPYASGFRVTLTGGSKPFTCDFGLNYWNAPARTVSRQLVAEGKLREGDTFRYRLLAFLGDTNPPARAMPGLNFNVTEIIRPPETRAIALAEFVAGAMPFGEQTAGDMPVFIPQHVVEETAALAEAAGAVETGGILIGHLGRDERASEIVALVTAQIPARQAEGESSKLTFTAATWTAVQSAITLRRTNEIYLGWWHSHPGSRYWCNPQCPPERRRQCPFAKDFFSEDDVCLHHTVFGKAFQIALVVTNTDDGLRHALFGWRAGVVAQRGFHVQRTDRPLHAEAASTNQEMTHATPCH